MATASSHPGLGVEFRVRVSPEVRAIRESLFTLVLSQLSRGGDGAGNKKDKLDIVYTPWANLKKTASMEVGQVGFFNDKEVKRIRVDTRCNEICNRLNKTKVEEYPDLALAREEYDKTCKRERQEAAREQKNRERMEQQERDNDKEARSYDRLLTVRPALGLCCSRLLRHATPSRGG
jgi:hypothetical protein